LAPKPRPIGVIAFDTAARRVARQWPMKWWRRRESNPRPQALYSQDYMLSLAIWISPRVRRRAGWRSASRFDGSAWPSGQTVRRGWC